MRLPPARPLRRIAVWRDDARCPVGREVRDALDVAVGLLSDDGVEVDEARPTGVSLDIADEVARRLLAGAVADRSSPLGAEFSGQSHEEWMRAHVLRSRMAAAWRRFFQDYDAVLLPVSPTTAIPHDARSFDERHILVDGVERAYWDQIVWACLTGIVHLPSTVVPVRLDQRGLPVGISITGGFAQDLTTLALAERLVGLVGSLGRPEV
ncbi:amidase family protein [Streptomyces sp. NPDC085479]|uniref:amidase family protein n=1 Tax=Streptomyces sp. NPDC085479 TaxID=3365726 RepID=UPI0037D0DF5C